jgi:hypothetical protein
MAHRLDGEGGRIGGKPAKSLIVQLDLAEGIVGDVRRGATDDPWKSDADADACDARAGVRLLVLHILRLCQAWRCEQSDQQAKEREAA